MNRRKTISILGCGWLGLPLASDLVKNDYRVKGSTTHIAKLSTIRSLGIQPFLVNLDPEYKGEGHFMDSEILLINLPPRNRSEDPDYHEKQLRNLLRQVSKSPIDKVVFISSTSVYPNNGKEVSEGDASMNATSRAGISLLAMEEIFRSDSNLKSTIIRFGGLYGPDRNPARFFSGTNEIPGGENPVNMIHLDDAIGVIKEVIENDYWNYTFNACSPKHPSKITFYNQAAIDSGLNPPRFVMNTTPHKIVSSDFLIETTGYHFSH